MLYVLDLRTLLFMMGRIVHPALWFLQDTIHQLLFCTICMPVWVRCWKLAALLWVCLTIWTISATVNQIVMVMSHCHRPKLKTGIPDNWVLWTNVHNCLSMSKFGYTFLFTAKGKGGHQWCWMSILWSHLGRSAHNFVEFQFPTARYAVSNSARHNSYMTVI